MKLIENFFEDPEAERANALTAPYESITHNALTYNGIARVEDPASVAKIASLVGAVDGFKEVTAMYRRYLDTDEQKTHIHSDVLIADVTVIAFLNKPEDCRGGVAFWTHKMTHWPHHPTSHQMLGSLKDTDTLWNRIHEDGFQEEFWEMNDYVPMAFNRAVAFWGARYHSRYPKDRPSTDINDARLIKVFFCKR